MAHGAVEPEEPGVERWIIVAVEAGCGCARVTAAHMTQKTGCVAVSAGEWEPGKIVVERHLRPVVGGVASAAVVPELTLMAVILHVAGYALGWRVDKLTPLVAAIT
jgi:hypothetical protein